ncbi:LysR family transcriptional regulator [Nocardioides speluncae]|uniref:LysR family transcriptional regulator n=1 Tax=Nocardioides speluncae TaxID=2670337 RepID=UPI000D698B7D|nr:LysR family transcriptional regulator [Nocardioides speluncae]
MLSLDRVDLLARFARLGSIAAVADEAGFTPSAVSQQLATLEREVGAALLERGPRSARLTGAGVVLAEHALGLLAQAQYVESEVKAASGEVGGAVTVGSVPTLAGRTARGIAAASSRFPDLRVALHQVESGPAGDLVAQGRLDLAVIDLWPGNEQAAWPGVTVHRLVDERLVLAGPAATGRSSLRARLPEIVAGHPWLCPPAGHPSREYGDALLASAGAVPRARWELEGLATIAELVEAGLGNGVLPASVLASRAETPHTRLNAARAVCLAVRDARAVAPSVREVAADLRRSLRAKR